MVPKDIQGEYFAGKAEITGEVLTVTLAGNLDMDAFSPLKSFYEEVHIAASKARVNRVDVKMNDLFFINSSCLKIFVSWISRVQEGSSDGTGLYMIRFLTNSKLQWQHRSFGALQALAQNIVTIESI